MSWFKKVFSSLSSQKAKVVYQKTEDEKSDETGDKQEREDTKITENEFKIDETQSSQSSQSSWWSFWSGLSSQYSSQKRELSNDENDEDDEKWQQSFCSSSDKKEKEKEEPIEILTQTAVDKDDNKKDDNKKDDDDKGNDEGKVEFFVKVGKNKKFKYY